MRELPHISRHVVGGEVVEVPRRFAEEHLAAGYADQEWGRHSTPTHELLGGYVGHDGSRVFVHHLDVGPTAGPEFELVVVTREEWLEFQRVAAAMSTKPEAIVRGTLGLGMRLTVLDEETVALYLVQFGAATFADE